MKTTGRTWAPTITLAKLFEEQNQFFDALAAYELISQTDASPAIRERIDALQMRILNDPANRYDPRIEKLFTPEELAYLKIMNHSGFTNLARAREKLSEGLLGQEIYIDEDDDLLPGEEEERGTLVQVLQEIETQAQLSVVDSPVSPEGLTLRDFMIALLTRFDQDTKLNDVKLSDLVAILLEMQGSKLPY